MHNPHEIRWDDKKIASLWNYYSKNEYFNSKYFTKVHGAEIARYLSKRIILNGKKLLDYGSGPGHLFESLKNLGIRVRYSALDFSNESVELLRSRFSKEAGFDNAFYVKDSSCHHIDEKFDIIMCCEVIEHLDDNKLGQMINAFKSMLVADGHIFITTPNDEDLEEMKNICPECGCIFHKWQHLRSWNIASLKQFMEKNGFETVSVRTVYFGQLIAKVKVFIKGLIVRQSKKPNLVYIGRLK